MEKIIEIFSTEKKLYVKSKPNEQSFTRKFIGKIGNVLFVLFCIGVLLLSVRGLSGNPTAAQLNNLSWRDDGPFELSPERGRYALLYAIVENHTVSFSKELAHFAAPDVGYQDGKYVSIFAPAVSVIVIPGYLLGKSVGLAQVGSFLVISFFALLNVLLIRLIALRLGAHPIAATIGAMAFLFGSPAFAYAVTLYQHHIATFFILFSIYLLMRSNSVRTLIAVWFLCALSFTVDYPNFFMLLPVGVLALLRSFVVQHDQHRATVNVSLIKLLSVFAVVVPMIFFLWFNQLSYGNPMQLSGATERAIEVKANGKPVLESEVYKARQKALHLPIDTQAMQKTTVLSFFKPRDMINGFYTHFLSSDRGMIYFTPVMLFGVVGLILAIRRKEKYTGLLVSIIGFNVLLYSMWGDPYGGWAFGSRYLIPTYAILSLYIATLLTNLKKYNLFLLLFFVVFSYSLAVNTMGAVTSNSNPPQVEILGLEAQSHKPQVTGILRNITVLDGNTSKSFVYQAFAGKYVSAWDYYIDLTVANVIVAGFLIIVLKTTVRRENYAV